MICSWISECWFLCEESWWNYQSPVSRMRCWQLDFWAFEAQSGRGRKNRITMDQSGQEWCWDIDIYNIHMTSKNQHNSAITSRIKGILPPVCRDVKCSVKGIACWPGRCICTTAGRVWSNRVVSVYGFNLDRRPVESCWVQNPSGPNGLLGAPWCCLGIGQCGCWQLVAGAAFAASYSPENVKKMSVCVSGLR